MIMKLQEIEKKENPMLDSTSFKFNLSFEGSTPSRKDLTAAIAKQVSAKPDQVSIEKVYSVFGQTSGYVMAKVYANQESKKLAEQDYLADRIAKVEKAQADKAEEKPAEKPAGGDSPKDDSPKKETPKEEGSKDEKPAETPKKDAPAEAPAEEKPKEDAPEKKD